MKIILPALFLMFIATQSPAIPLKAGQESPKFLKISYNDSEPEALQTAITSYEKDGVKVDLIGVIHVADKAYYKSLNKQFDQYDVVLYELVAPPGTVPDKGRGGFVSMIAKILLELDHQTERINYKRQNFIHADLSFAEMSKVMAKRGEDPFILGLRTLADVLQQKNLAERNPIPAMMLGLEVQNADTPAKTRRLFARQLVQQIDTGIVKSVKAVLIGDRNERCMEVFREQRKAGKTNMAIFYGAAHMADFDQRLRDLGFAQTKQRWLAAWDLSDE